MLPPNGTTVVENAQALILLLHPDAASMLEHYLSIAESFVVQAEVVAGAT